MATKITRTCILLLFISTIPVLIFAEIITLVKEKNVTCVVTDLAVNSAIYLNPPIRSNFVKKTTEINNWIQDDWLRTHSMSSSYSPVTDKRWEDFYMSSEKDGYPLENNPFSFSIYTSGPITFTIFSYDFSDKTILEFKPEKDSDIIIMSSSCQWFHYSTSTQNDTVNILKGDEIVETFKLTFHNPYWLYVNSPCSNTTFWKVHNYEFRSSNTVTRSNAEKSYLNFSFSDNLCLSLYVSVDKFSYLQVDLESNNKNKILTIFGFNQENSFKKWKKINITADSPGPAKLSFFRGHLHKLKQGYWAIDDIKFCNNDLEIYQTQLATTLPENPTCQDLDESNMNIEVNSFTKPGSLGRVNCSTVLGTSYPYCEKHKICLADSTCFCSWGYQGDFCNQTCDIGTWGLFCTQQCPFSCKKCNPATGDCLEKRDENMKLTKEELPKSISLVSGKTYIEMPNYEDINAELTYNFEYYCTSEWCQGELVKEDTYNIASPSDYKQAIVQNFDEMVPFTDYKLLVSITRRDEICPKRDYSTIKAQPELDNIKLVVYSSNETHLQIRFQPSQTPSEITLNYSIWYIQDGRPINSTQIQQCKFWDDYMCGTISNLKSNTSYNIIVGEKNFANGTFRISSSVVGFTSEKAPEVPTKFEVKEFSDKGIVLSWNQPDITNGPLRYFGLDVANQETIKHYNILATDELTYEQKISVTTGSNYTCSLRAFNTHPGETIAISVKIVPPSLKWHIPQPFAEICSETCQLVIPKPKEYAYSDYYIRVIYNENTMGTETKISESEIIWTSTELKEDSNFIRLEINPELEKNFSLDKDNNYSFDLVLLVNNNYRVYEPVILSPCWSSLEIISIIGSFVFLLLLFLGLKHKLSRHNVFVQLPREDKSSAEQFGTMITDEN